MSKQLFRFVLSGIAAVGTDMATYYLLIQSLDKNVAKAISFILGTLVAYFLNKLWTFEEKNKSFAIPVRFAILYLGSLGLNVLVNKTVLSIESSWVIIAFLFATGASAVTNFIGQKFWVFRNSL